MDGDFSAESYRGGFPGAAGVGGTESPADEVPTESSGGGYPGSPDVGDTESPAGATLSVRAARELYMKPSPRSHVVIQPPPGWIYWMSWGTLFSGDCRMVGALLHLYPDAMVFFQSYTISSDDDDIDVWLLNGIQFVDGAGRPVGRPLPKHVGMQMAWQGSEYPLTFWDAIPGVTPSGAAQIRGGLMHYRC